MTGFCTCVNIGNILGVQITTQFLKITDNKWYWSFVVLSIWFLLLAIVQAIFLVPHPEKVGIVIEEEVIQERFNEEIEKAVIISEEIE